MIEDGMELEESPGAQRAPSLGDKTKMPKTPDLSERLIQPRRASPFALDDFRSSAEANTVKP